MSNRELIVLGTGSQVPSRARNHNGYLLRWDSMGLLFDPGEGTQRQLIFAGVPVSAINRICLTHFHGDHCLGVPGVVQRLSLDGVERVHAHYPASGRAYFERLRHASVFHETTELVERPIGGDGVVADGESASCRPCVSTTPSRRTDTGSSNLMGGPWCRDCCSVTASTAPTSGPCCGRARSPSVGTL